MFKDLWRHLWRPAIALQCAAAGLLAIPVTASAQTSLFDEYTVTSWTDEDGLFGGWIVGLAQDQHGYLWIGTVSGLLRFDGLRFERFRPSGDDPLPQRSLSSVYAARDGSVWVGFTSGGGVCRILDGRITDYGPPHGLGEGRVMSLTEDVDGRMLVATADGLFRLVDDRWERLGAAQGLPDGPIQSLFRDPSGALWAVSSSAVLRRARMDESFRAVPNARGRPLAFSESGGVLWTTDPQTGYATLDGTGGEAPATPMEGSGSRLLHDRDGNLWVATLGQGLWFVRRGARTPEVIGIHNGLTNDTVRSLFEDRNGDVWVGTTSGLHRFARRRVVPMTDLGVVRVVEADPHGGVWVGTMAGLVRLEGGTRRWYGTADGLPADIVSALHADLAGRLWVATERGVAVFEDGRLAALPLVQGQWPVAVNAIAVDRRGDLWISTADHGLFRWRDGHLRSVRLPAGISMTVYSVATDRSGRLWLMLAGGGIGRMEDDGHVEVLRESDRFHRTDLAAYGDAQGTMWFGAGERLTRFRDGVLSAITASQGMPGEAVRAIVSDASGYLWIGTSGGLVRLADDQFDRVLEDRERRLEFRGYNSADGLAGVPIRTGFPNAVRSTDGQLWFVTANGLTVVDPERLAPTRPAPPVRIERVTAGGRAYEPDSAVALPAGTSHLQIEFTALEFFSPRHVQFRYRLEGFDEGWTDAGTQRVASFTNLPPRRYRFHVIARSSEGIWNEFGDTLHFSVAPMFYETRWFYSLCLLAVVAIVLAGWRLRLRQVQQQFGLVLTERARMAREIHDTLLQSLAGLELQVGAMSTQLDSSQPAVRQQLDRVRRQIQFDVSEARQSIWDLRSPALETRDLATTLDEMGRTVATSAGVRFEFVLGGQPALCARKIEEHVLRIGREAVSNAVRHARATLIRLELQYSASTLTLRVSDDGCGFDPDAVSRQKVGHWGVAAMHERAQAIGGHLTLVSRPGTGTHLEMVAPLLYGSQS